MKRSSPWVQLYFLQDLAKWRTWMIIRKIEKAERNLQKEKGSIDKYKNIKRHRLSNLAPSRTKPTELEIVFCYKCNLDEPSRIGHQLTPSLALYTNLLSTSPTGTNHSIIRVSLKPLTYYLKRQIWKQWI